MDFVHEHFVAKCISLINDLIDLITVYFCFLYFIAELLSKMHEVYYAICSVTIFLCYVLYGCKFRSKLVR